MRSGGTPSETRPCAAQRDHGVKNVTLARSRRTRAVVRALASPVAGGRPLYHGAIASSCRSVASRSRMSGRLKGPACIHRYGDTSYEADSQMTSGRGRHVKAEASSAARRRALIPVGSAGHRSSQPPDFQP